MITRRTAIQRFGPPVLLACGLLASCRMGADIAIVPHGLKPKFVVTYDHGKRACVKGLTVTAVAAGQRKDVWAVRQGNGTPPCADRMTYGATPAGYETVVPARPLSPQGPYEVAAAGSGWGETRPFRVP